jgi:predicted nucleic acid-binding protein
VKVLVDTCVWSNALRHKNPNRELTQKLSDLVSDGRALLIGPIRQEILSGISNPAQFKKLKGILAAFEDIPLQKAHFEKAAEFCNTCRSKGIQGSTIDFLLCAIACAEHVMIFTIDNDFLHYAKHLPIKLFK